MKMRETSRAVDKKLQVNNYLVIDNSYRDSIKVALHNHSNVSYEVNPGDRIAQLVVLPFVPCELIECDGLDKTERGTGGFGSSGK